MKTAWTVRFFMVVVAWSAAFTGERDFATRLRTAEELRQQGNNAEAETILLAALQETENLLPEDFRKAVVLNNLALLYQSMDLNSKAEACLRRAVGIEERTIGEGDLMLLRSRMNLASLYIQSGQYDKAGRLGLRHCLDRYLEKERKDPDLARLLAILAALEHRQGRVEQAEKYSLDALALRESIGSDGDQTIDLLNNLGVLYGELGRNAEALACYERALAIAEKSLGPEHHALATLLANVGTFHFVVHSPARAEQYYRRALIVAENSLGPDSSLVAQLTHYYAEVLERTDRKSEARQCRRRANAILDAGSKGDLSRHTVDLGELMRRAGSR